MCISGFPKCTGLKFYEKSILVLPITSSLKRNCYFLLSKTISFELFLYCWYPSITEIILQKNIVDIGDAEFQIGLMYVVLPRVKTLNGLLPKPSFNYDRLLKINNSKAMTVHRDNLYRL